MSKALFGRWSRPAAVIAAVGMAGTALTACHAASSPESTVPGQAKEQAMQVPPVVDARLDNADDPGATALRAQVVAALGPDYAIAGEQWMLAHDNLGWNAVSKFVASKRSPDGKPPKAIWTDTGPRTIDIYPATGNRPAFAVAMDPARRADGTWLIGYFTLTPR